MLHCPSPFYCRVLLYVQFDQVVLGSGMKRLSFALLVLSLCLVSFERFI